MTDWKLLITFTYPQEAYIIKGRLESEEIEVMLKDELTAQVDNFYSNAIGGVKLMVLESDYDRAYKILLDSGYIHEEIIKQNKFLSSFDRVTSKLPLIGKSILAVRLFVVVTFMLILIVVPIALLSLPSKLEYLTDNYWCVEKIYFKGKEISPNTVGLKFQMNNNCYETMRFMENGDVIFPGINSYDNWNKWELRNDSIIVTEKAQNSDLTTSESIYVGKYSLEINQDFIKLKSHNLIIIGKSYNSIIGF